MEEKERYVIRYDLDYNVCLIDTEKNQGVGDYIQIVKLLNQQDKRIKELENKHLLSESEYQRYCSFKIIEPEIKGCLDREKNLEQENQQLKQQLHDLPKKIVEEVEKNFTEYLPLKYKTGAGFYSRLNAILKKYGVEDE